MTVSSRPGDKVERLERVELGRNVPGGPGGGTFGLYKSPSSTPVFHLQETPRREVPPKGRTLAELELQAIDAHHRGIGWADFWPSVAGDVARLQPWDRRKYGRIRDRLLSLLVSGDNEVEPIGSHDWEADDR